MKIEVCVNCGETVFTDDGGCVICLCTEKEKVDPPKRIRCDECGRVLDLGEDGVYVSDSYLTKYPIASVPYLNIKAKTFYCGCNGWD